MTFILYLKKQFTQHKAILLKWNWLREKQAKIDKEKNYMHAKFSKKYNRKVHNVLVLYPSKTLYRIQRNEIYKYFMPCFFEYPISVFDRNTFILLNLNVKSLLLFI